MRSIAQGILVALFAFGLGTGARSADVTATFVGTSGEWTDGSLWSTSPLFPENGALTYAVIVGSTLPTVSVNLSRDLAVDSLALQNAVFTTSGTLSLAQGLTLGQNGRILDGTIVASGASLFSGAGMRISSASFVSQGSTTWQSGDLTLSSGSIENSAGASFTIAGSASRTLVSPIGGSVLNAGELFHTSSGVTTFEAPFTNTGMVYVQAGALRLFGSPLGGSFDVAAGATLRLGGNVDALVFSQGNVELDNAVLGGSVTDSGTTTVLRRGTVTAAGLVGAERLIVDVDSIGLRVDGEVTAGDLFWQEGRIFGSGEIEILDSFVIEGEGAKLLESFGMRSDHAILWDGGSIGLSGGARIMNGAASVMTVDSTSGPLTLSSALGDGLARNDGQLRKLGSGSANFATRLENAGSVDVLEGTLAIHELWNEGSFAIADGATLELSGGSDFANDSTLGGPGTLHLTGGLHFLRGALNPGAIVVEGYTTDARFVEPMGTYTGAFASLGGSASFDYFAVDLANVERLSGVLSMADGSRIGGEIDWSFGRLTNPGSVELYGDATVLSGYVSADLVHTGSMAVSGGLALEPGASLLNAVGAEIRLQGALGESGAPTGTTSVRNEGVVIAAPPANGGSIASFVTQFVNAGIVEIRGDGFASNSFQATADFSDFRQTDGTLWLHGGDIRTFNGAPLRIEGGSLIGEGNLFVNVENHGRIAPGNPGEIGRLTVLGLSLFEDAELDFEIGGTERGIGFDAIDVRDLVLDGTLSVRFVDGFEHAVTAADEFDVVVASRSLEGVLANVVSGARLATADGLGSFAVFYGEGSPFGATSLVLTDFRAVPEPAALALLLLAGGAALTVRLRRGGGSPAR